jgi:hypothetical protein
MNRRTFLVIGAAAITARLLARVPFTRRLSRRLTAWVSLQRLIAALGGPRNVLAIYDARFARFTPGFVPIPLSAPEPIAVPILYGPDSPVWRFR